MSVAKSDRFLVLAGAGEAEIRVKGSRFLGRAIPVDVEADAVGAIALLRKREHDATHHCSALRVGEPGRVLERADDDGEPTHSAGAPILAVLQGAALHGALIVVTRWFGGTKLGTGGLVRAYGEAAREALAAAKTAERLVTRTLVAASSFEEIGVVEALLARAGEAVVAVARRFEPAPEFTIEVVASRAEALAAELVEASAGRVSVKASEVGRTQR